MSAARGDAGELWQLEEAFWLEGASFYEQRLAVDALMVFPDPAGVMDREATIRAMRGTPRWLEVQMQRRVDRRFENGTAILLYDAEGYRGEGPAYKARCSSLYVMELGGWRLALHHQTPL